MWGSLFVLLGSSLGFVVAYNTYGRWLGRKVFQLSAERICPSVEFRDDRDFVPSNRWVVFGHHFTSIAGTGPIVGPAIAVIWGWLPALLWVVFGSIFIGAVHDLATLVVSLRNRGQTIGDIAGTYLGARVRLLFLGTLFVCITIVIAVFGLVIANVFRLFPSAILPCIVQIPLAILIGFMMKGRTGSPFGPALFALVAMFVIVFTGDLGVFHEWNTQLAAMPIWLWTVILLSYGFCASVLPVWVLLQPRDFINALQLLSTILLLALGVVAAMVFGGPTLSSLAEGAEPTRQSLSFVAPMVNWNPEGAPFIFPFLFVTIACGAISGFHCLVASGTSSKQLATENDARMVGYGSMLTEGFLAVLVLLCCAVGLGLGVPTPGGVLTGVEAWQHQYQSWSAAGSLGAMVGAFVQGAGNFLGTLGLPTGAATALMGVFVASFAATTLDSACRLQRYVVQELAGALQESAPKPLAPVLQPLRNTFVATAFAVGCGAMLAAIPARGQEWSLENAGLGGMLLWPVFGASNQLLGGLAFIVVIFYLRHHQKPLWFALPPALFMLVIPFWAMSMLVFFGDGKQPGWLASGEYLLATLGTLALLLEVWMVIEALVRWRKQ